MMEDTTESHQDPVLVSDSILPPARQPSKGSLVNPIQKANKSTSLSYIYSKIRLVEGVVEEQTGEVINLSDFWTNISRAVQVGSAQGILQTVRELMKFTKTIGGIQNSTRKVLVIELTKLFLQQQLDPDSLQYTTLVQLLPNLIDTFCQLAKATRTLFKHSSKMCC
jgi:hypothetical protein